MTLREKKQLTYILAVLTAVGAYWAILGEYLGRNYIESKRRPVFLVKKIYHAQALSSYVNDEII